MECDYCFTNRATIEIMLQNGDCYYVCNDTVCAVEIIKLEASTENPVDSMEAIEGEEN